MGGGEGARGLEVVREVLAGQVPHPDCALCRALCPLWPGLSHSETRTVCAAPAQRWHRTTVDTTEGSDHLGGLLRH